MKADDLLNTCTASADLGAGEKLAKKCTACHAFGSDGKAKVGPALWNIVTKKELNLISVFCGKSRTGVWDYQSLLF